MIDQEIQSQGIFRQTIGRGTRISERYGKLGFTIMIRGATLHFLDPDWDGIPEIVIDGDNPIPPSRPPRDTEPQPRHKYYLRGYPVIIARDELTYYNEEGEQVTESLVDYSRNAALEVCGRSFEEFQVWNHGDRQEIMTALWETQFPFDEIQEELGLEMLVGSISSAMSPMIDPRLREGRGADNVKKRVYILDMAMMQGLFWICC